MKLHWNYWLQSFLAVATKRRSETTSYLNNDYDVMNYFANFEKFLPHSIIMQNFLTVRSQMPGAFLLPAPPPPPPYELGLSNTLSFPCHNFICKTTWLKTCADFTRALQEFYLWNFWTLVSQILWSDFSFQVWGLFEAWRLIFRCVQWIHVERKLISWFCTLDVSSEVPTPGREMSTTIYRYSFFHNHSWPWSEFVHIMPDILPWRLGLIFWTTSRLISTHFITTWRNKPKIKIFT